jgi:hypothetical protein
VRPAPVRRWRVQPMPRTGENGFCESFAYKSNLARLHGLSGRSPRAGSPKPSGRNCCAVNDSCQACKLGCLKYRVAGLMCKVLRYGEVHRIIPLTCLIWIKSKPDLVLQKKGTYVFIPSVCLRFQLAGQILFYTMKAGGVAQNNLQPGN